MADGAVYAATRQAVEVEPLNAAAHHALGLAAEARGSLQEAITALRMAASLLPANYGAKFTQVLHPPSAQILRKSPMQTEG